jgi:predicted unusual protein kinase regulating ubiquinone biosynthesis (AarF/ABC1/UbiB family)
VLTTEWIDGSEISALPPSERLVMAQMAVEACVAQLTYTGFVHADPHEGNLLLDKADGSLVFLDFGLVTEVEPFVMEGFARGIQCMIAGDWLGLTRVFREVGLTPPDNYYRKTNVKGEKKKRLEVCSAEEMAGAIKAALEAEEGGQSRFDPKPKALNLKPETRNPKP